MKIYRMLSFGSTNDSGNTSLVIENSSLSRSERLLFAQQQDASATVFLEVKAADETELDYYYPHARSPLCLHATLAASAVYFDAHPGCERTRFITSMYGQCLEVERDNERVYVRVEEQRPPLLNVDVAETVRLLRMEHHDHIRSIMLTSVGSPKLLAEIMNRPILNALCPDLPAIANWSRAHGISGIYAYCHLHGSVFAGRNFHHLNPRFEDAATGVAAGALAIARKESITLLQGANLGQPCKLDTRYTKGFVQIGGRVVNLGKS